MKKLVLLIVLLLPVIANAQIWQETFNGLANGATSDAGATAWTTVQPTGSGRKFNKQTPASGYELFEVDNTGSEGVWTSQSINISAYTEVALEVTLYSYFTYSTDYIRCYYSVDGGPETKFGELLGSNGLNITSAASAIVSGGTVKIIIRGYDGTPGTNSSFGFAIDQALAFDDVTATSIKVLYSIANGDFNTGSTWSTAGFTGATCNCTPDASSRVIIGNNKTVLINNAATAAGVEVRNTGKLNWNANNIALTMARGGKIVVNSGGQMSYNSKTGSSIIYNNYSYSVINDGILSVGTVTLNAGSNLTISGSGTTTVNGNIANGMGAGRTLTMNMAAPGSMTITGDLSYATSTSNYSAVINDGILNVNDEILFDGSNASFTNNGTLSLTTGMTVNGNTDNGNSFTNSTGATATIPVFSLGNGDFTVNNSGSITQSGNFNNVDAGSAFKNLDGGTWNWAGTGSGNVKLYCNNGTNTFNYSRGGAQNVIIPQDNYLNLTISGTGAKSFAAATDINGNFSIQGTAQADITSANFALTVAGDWLTTSTNADPFLQRSGTVTFDGAADQELSSVKGDEAFYNLIINKTGGNVVLDVSPTATTATVSNILTLTNGGLDINGNTLNITNSSTGAIARTNGFIISETNTTPYSPVKWSVGLGTGSYVFPFGKSRAASDYIPFTFNITTAGIGVGTVSVSTYGTISNNKPYPSGVSNVNTTPGADNSTNTADRFWIITPAGYGTNPYARVTFTVTPTEASGIANLNAQHWNGSSWDAPQAGQTSTATSARLNTAVNTFSPWTLAGNNTILPVTLTTFTATPQAKAVQLDWSTATETNNHYFTIERTTDSKNFIEVARIEGNGTSVQKHSYVATDASPVPGRSYYRLKQTDYDGNVTYSDLRTVEYTGGSEDASLALYPNPTNDGYIVLEIRNLHNTTTLPITIFNTQGQSIITTTIEIDTDGFSRNSFTLPSQTQPGIYILQAGTHIQKFIVK